MRQAPITADLVWQIFSTYGFIQKLIVINKNAGLQALVQYEDQKDAEEAKAYLNSKTVYVGEDKNLSTTLYIQYSHLNELTLRTNSTYSRDYVNELPWDHDRDLGGGYRGRRDNRSYRSRPYRSYDDHRSSRYDRYDDDYDYDRRSSSRRSRRDDDYDYDRRRSSRDYRRRSHSRDSVSPTDRLRALASYKDY